MGSIELLLASSTRPRTVGRLHNHTSKWCLLQLMVWQLLLFTGSSTAVAWERAARNPTEGHEVKKNTGAYVLNDILSQLHSMVSVGEGLHNPLNLDKQVVSRPPQQTALPSTLNDGGKCAALSPSPSHNNTAGMSRDTELVYNGNISNIGSLLEPFCSTASRHLMWLGRKTYERAFHFQPLLLPRPAFVKEHPRIQPYEALLAFGMSTSSTPSVEKITAYVMNTYQADGQTWRIFHVLDFSELLPFQCQDPDDFQPAITLSMSRQQVYFFGFGPQAVCSVLLVWDIGSRHLSRVNATDGQQVPHVYHTLVTIETNMTGSVQNADTERDHGDVLLSYGGTFCGFHDVYACPEEKISAGLWRFDFNNTLSDGIVLGRWSKVPVETKPGSPYPSARISASVFFAAPDRILMYGGIGVVRASELNESNESLSCSECREVALCDLWQLNLGTLTWQVLSGNLTLNCAQRAPSNCFGFPRFAYRQFCAYDPVEEVISVPTIVLTEFSLGALCNIGSFALSRFYLNSVESGWRTWEQTSAQDLYIVASGIERLLSSGFATATHRVFCVDLGFLLTSDMTLRYDHVTGMDSVNLQFLPDNLNKIYRFAGNTGCISPAPIVAESRSFEKEDYKEHYFIVLGGFCLLKGESPDNRLLASWDVLPVWSYLNENLEFGYLMKLVRPAPEFLHQVFHTVVPLSEEPVAGQNIRNGAQAPAQGSPGTVHKAALYGGVSLLGHIVPPDVWCFDLREHYWTQANLTTNTHVPQWRSNAIFGHVAFPVPGPSSAFAIYGGFQGDFGLPLFSSNRSYMFEFSNLEECEGQWVELQARSRPLPGLALHSVTIVSSDIYVFGGLCELEQRNSLLRLQIDRRPSYTVEWVEVKQARTLPAMFGHSLTEFTPDFLLLLGGIHYDSARCHNNLAGFCFNSKGAVAYLMRIGGGGATDAAAAGSQQRADIIPFFPHHPIALHKAVSQFIFGGAVNAAEFRQEYARLMSQDCHSQIPSSSCPLGYGRNGSTCMPCPQEYISTGTGGKCVPCPKFQVTNGTGQTMCMIPPPCKDNSCHGHGTCYSVDLYVAACSCEFGYTTYDNCQLPFTYLGMGATIAAVLLCVTLILRRCILLRRKAQSELVKKERELLVSRWKLGQLSRGSRIQYKELTFLNQIGEGAFGQVFLAELSCLKVAVKTLRGCRLSRRAACKRFQVEAEHMRTVHHPNIVMFF
eukprot:scpid25682/ scgid30730/ 